MGDSSRSSVQIISGSCIHSHQDTAWPVWHTLVVFTARHTTFHEEEGRQRSPAAGMHPKRCRHRVEGQHHLQSAASAATSTAPSHDRGCLFFIFFFPFSAPELCWAKR